MAKGAKGSAKGGEGANLASNQRAKRDKLGQQKVRSLVWNAPLFGVGVL